MDIRGMLAMLIGVTVANAAGAPDRVGCDTMGEAAARIMCSDIPTGAPAGQTAQAGRNSHVATSWWGPGARQTETFHMDGPWVLDWSAGPEFFSATLHRARSGEVLALLANQVGKLGGQAGVAAAGDYFIRFAGDGPWSANLITLGARPPSMRREFDPDLAGDSGAHDNLPECNTSAAAQELAKVIEASPIGRQQFLRVLRVVSITTSLSSSGVDICHALLMTTGGERRYGFHYTRHDGELFMLASPE